MNICVLFSLSPSNQNERPMPWLLFIIGPNLQMSVERVRQRSQQPQHSSPCPRSHVLFWFVMFSLSVQWLYIITNGRININIYAHTIHNYDVINSCTLGRKSSASICRRRCLSSGIIYRFGTISNTECTYVTIINQKLGIWTKRVTSLQRQFEYCH